MKRLKAYQVSDGDDGCCVRFATNNATARREGANELDRGWEEIESCSRRPEFDAYAPGPVPPVVLIANNWRFECLNVRCQNWVYDDIEGKCFSAGGDPYCCQTCMATHFARQRGTEAAQVAIQELVELRLPGVQVTEAYVYGQRLEPQERGGGYCAYVDFTFAGGRYPARFVFGEDGYRVHGDDISAFRRLFPEPPQDTATA